MYLFTSKCASRHNGVQFFISHLASWLRTRRFSEPTFRPSGAPHQWKNTVNRDFPTFSRICIFCLLTLSLLIFSLLILSLLTLLTSAFQLSILSEVSLLNFLRPCADHFPRGPWVSHIYVSLLWVFSNIGCLTSKLTMNCGSQGLYFRAIPKYWGTAW